MKRREFVEKLGVGSVGVVAAAAIAGRATTVEGQHQHAQVDGPLANAVMAFGAWMTSPPLDRFPNNNPRTANLHHVQPYMATIKAGGTVTFTISGVHQIVIYGEGTTLETITRNIIETVPPVPGPFFPGFIDDPVNRIYRGPDPRVFFPSQDRIEVVSLANPGTYLVVCSLVPHFDEGMHGWIKVLPR